MRKLREFKNKRIRTYKGKKRIFTETWYKCFCDECKKEFETRKQSFVSGQKRHPGICLCKHCSNISKYRKLPSGRNHKLYKHGLNSSGYRRIKIDGKMIYEHRLVAEKMIGRKLEKKEQVHHIDMNVLNNKEYNLLIASNLSEHNLYHYQMEKIGISFLGICIFFNKEQKVYELIEDDIEEINFAKLENVTIGGKYRYKRFGGVNRAFHIYLIEQDINRRLFSNECVHHINFNKRDNSFKNLFLMTKSEHRKAHFSLQRCVGKLVEKGIVKYDKVNKRYVA